MINPDTTGHKLDHQQVLIISSSNTHDPMHLFHQIHAPMSLVLIFFPWFVEAKIHCTSNWTDEVRSLVKTWNNFCP